MAIKDRGRRINPDRATPKAMAAFAAKQTTEYMNPVDDGGAAPRLVQDRPCRVNPERATPEAFRKFAATQNIPYMSPV